MFKQKQRNKANRPYNLPAPIKGLDAISPLMSMDAKSAIVLDNFFPMPDGVELRDGNEEHATGFTDPVERLHVYAATNGGESLWATTVDGVYDVTSAGAIGAAAIALTEGKTNVTTIATGAGNYLMLANGVDTIKQYDGTTWTSIATFGATATSTYSHLTTYRQRLFLVKKNSLEIEYLAVNSISGAASNYPLGAILKGGGYIIAIGTWTIDGGSGPEDNLVAITNKGEIAVFTGSDPSSATTWSLKGVYQVGVPLGANCLFKYGGDLLIMTEDGIYPMSSAVQSAAIDRISSVSEAVRPLFNAAAKLYSANDGWQIIADPIKPCLLVNVPATPVKKQFVMHSQTQAWCTYSGWEANCWARMNKELYFGDGDSVCRVTGFADQGTYIRGTMLQSYQRLGAQQTKKIDLTKAYVQANGGFTYTLGYACDFTDPRETSTFSPYGNITPYLWGTGIFGEAVWTGITGISQDWQTVPDDYTLWKGAYLYVQSNNARIRYYGQDVLYNLGGSI
jgi:hypothetical protein